MGLSDRQSVEPSGSPHSEDKLKTTIAAAVSLLNGMLLNGILLTGVLLSGVLLNGGLLCAAPAPDAKCVECHDEKGAPFHASVHSDLGCTGCHTDIKGFPHPDQVAKVKCAACHSDAAATLASSVHKGAAPQPCEACHGDLHAIVNVKDPKSPVYPLNMPRTCGTCHGDNKSATQKSDPQKGAPQHPGAPNEYSEYMDSIHGAALTKDGLLVAATCSSCHGAHDILDPKDPKSRTSKANLPATCGACHQGIQNQYLAGSHGKALQAGNPRAPVCTDCHAAHDIAEVRNLSFQMKTSATCGGCHQERYGTYNNTFHAQVSALGYVETAHCWDCHSAHEILPASDPRSTVAKANLIQTCGKCHVGAGASFVTYSPHADPRNAQVYPVMHAAAGFMNWLLAGVLGFFTLHTALWFIRSTVERSRSRRDRI